RARPGLITLFTQPEVYAPIASQLQAVMAQPWREDLDFSDFTAALFGPGLAAKNLSPHVRESLRELWRRSASPIVVDASALDWLAREASPTSATRVITPHPG